MKWLLNRLSEPSTWAAVGTIVTTVTGALYHGVPASAAIATAIPAVLGVVIPEAKHG